MLVELSVKNIALIENIHLRLNRGLNTFTGETGAGKSILLDAIGLLLGNRASTELIRRNEEKGLVEALFQFDGSPLQQVRTLLDGWGNGMDGDQLLVSRELHRSNRTVCRINGRMATVQMLRDLGEKLVQQHGQHEHQGLLQSEEQLRLLDLYGHHSALLEDVADAFAKWKDAHRQLASMQMDEQERMRRLDMLTFQIDEIDAASLKPGEEDQLREVRGRLQHAERIQSAVQTAIDILSGGHRGQGVIDQIATAQSEIASALKYDEGLEQPRGFIETAMVHVDEATRSLSKYLHGIENDPRRLEMVENRLAEIRGLQRKYGATIEDVLDYADSSRREKATLTDHEDQVTEMERQVKKYESELLDVSMRLHDSRVNFALQLSREVEAVLQELNMPRATFRIDVTKRPDDENTPNFGSLGFDVVTFLFSANKGEAVRPLHKIASGGELSRTLLAVKSVLAKVDDLDTLIFDEIDTGVSGSATTRIAEQLMKLGATRQVLCVTHSAQIAAAASSHFRIHKQEQDEDTRTQVELLSRDGRVEEIARLVGAAESDETAVLHAEALLESFQVERNVNG